MKYRVVEERYASDLANKVEELIKFGWKPQGGVCYWRSSLNEYYKQAMVKE